MKLVVTVAHGDGDALDETYAFYPDASNATTATKGAAIVNTYSAGTLNVGKRVLGNLWRQDKEVRHQSDLHRSGEPDRQIDHHLW